MSPHVTEEQLADLVDQFYARVRQDDLIGPLFNRAVGDWPAHLEKLAHFWSSVMLRSGRYKGHPVAEHLKHMAEISPEMFARWLLLWKQTTNELMQPDVAAELQEKAARIGESLQLALKFNKGEPTVTPPGEKAAFSREPYRSTPVFDEHSLPAALRREHRTKAGTWGVIRVLSGELRLHLADSEEVRQLSKEHPGVVEPEQTHWVEPVGPVQMQVDFHAAPPVI
jgi:truncated hemoglobin YjbI/tellurite resistance-related uncharacterized protein